MNAMANEANSFDGHISQPGSTFDTPSWQLSPEATVFRIVAIVTHHEEVVWFDFDGSPIVSPTEHSMPKTTKVFVDHIWFVSPFAISEESFVMHTQFVTRHANEPFDKVLRIVFGILKDYDVTSFWSSEEQTYSIDEYVIARKKCVFHGACGDVKGFDDKGLNEHKKDGYFDEGLNPVTDRAFEENIEFKDILIRKLKSEGIPPTSHLKLSIEITF